MRKKLVEYNQSNILDAAKRLFQANGISGTSVDEIARTAECSKATIYVYFKNKDDIYYHIVLEYMTALRDSVKSCFSGAADYKKAYFSLCNTLIRFKNDYPMYFECILGNISVEPTKMQELPVLKSIFDVGEEINDIVCGFLIRGQADGFIRKDINPLQATFVMWSSICGLISLNANKHMYLTGRLKIKEKHFLRNGFDMILRMVTDKGGI